MEAYRERSAAKIVRISVRQLNDTTELAAAALAAQGAVQASA